MCFAGRHVLTKQEQTHEKDRVLRNDVTLPSEHSWVPNGVISPSEHCAAKSRAQPCFFTGLS